MGDKNDSKSKHGKKLTTKEKKAQNHLKLMDYEQRCSYWPEQRQESSLEF
jgi:hypothetical protein